MDNKQNEWLYDILCEYEFDEAVKAFKENIATLGFEKKLADCVGEEVAKLDDTTVDREKYLSGRIAECERIMRDMRTIANDEMQRDKYQTGLYLWNYVLAEAVRAVLSERVNMQPQPITTVLQEVNNMQRNYSDDLVALFHGHAELIDELVGLSDDEIARRIKSWATQMDKFGKPMIENPKNCQRSAYARALKGNNIIHCTIDVFKRKL